MYAAGGCGRGETAFKCGPSADRDLVKADYRELHLISLEVHPKQFTDFYLQVLNFSPGLGDVALSHSLLVIETLRKTAHDALQSHYSSAM